MSINFQLFSRFFFLSILQIIRKQLVLLLSGKDVVLPIGITFKRIDSAILNLTHFALKILRCGILMIPIELTNPVFTDIAFGASHTYSHWARTPQQCPQRGEGAASRSPTSKDPHPPG